MGVGKLQNEGDLAAFFDHQQDKGSGGIATRQLQGKTNQMSSDLTTAQANIATNSANITALQAKFPVVSADIADGTIAAVDLADGSVTTSKLAQMPQVRAKRTSDSSSVSDSSWTAIQFNGEDFDLGTGTEQHSTSSNTTRLTCRVGGLYVIMANLAWDSNGTGVRGARVVMNGSTVLGAIEMAACTPNFTQCPAAAINRLSIGDYVEVEGWQSSGGGLVVKANGSSGASTILSWHFVSP